MAPEKEASSRQSEEGEPAEDVSHRLEDASNVSEHASKPEAESSTETSPKQKEILKGDDSQNIDDVPQEEVGDEQSLSKPPAKSKEAVPSSSWVLILNDASYNNYPYYMNTNGLPSQLYEPGEPYYVYDSITAKYEPDLRQPSTIGATEETTGDASKSTEEYTGYNPKIHGSYDPNASYNDYHKRKREGEAGDETAKKLRTVEDQYSAMGAFNRVTGQFQTADQSTERFDDYHKSGRQMGAFFDVDAAANAHGGRSLKEERRNQKLSAKQLRDLKEKTKQKKEEKKRRWLLS